MIDNLIVFKQSSIKIVKDKIIYFDPFEIDDELHDADIIFITHDHFDHFDVDSIKKIINKSTYIVIPESFKEKAKELASYDHIISVVPDNNYNVLDIKFKTVPAYNNSKPYHPKENNWVGYLVYFNNYSYYIMGDTDDTSDARKVTCDVLFIPIGGTYTMDKIEAVNYTNYIKPKVVIPIHYGRVVGTKEDALYFINNIDKNIIGKILIE